MATVVPRSSLSETINRDLFRDELREASGPESDDPEIIDYGYDERPEGEHLAYTGRPDRNLVYPLLIVEEGGDTGVRPDRRSSLHEHAYDVRVTIQHNNKTQLMQLRDQLRGWFEGNIMLLQTNGFEDPELSIQPATFPADARVHEIEATFSGIVNTGDPE